MKGTGRISLPESKKIDTRESRRSEYLSAIVSAATLAPPGVEVDTSIKCRKRPERKLCHGLIRLRLQENPAELIWWCPVCADSGVIRNWKGIPWNLSHTKGAGVINGDEYCEVILTNDEYKLLSEIAILEPQAQKIVQDASIIENGVMLIGSLDAMDELMGYIAFEANHEQKNRRQQALNCLFDKINVCILGKW